MKVTGTFYVLTGPGEAYFALFSLSSSEKSSLLIISWRTALGAMASIKSRTGKLVLMDLSWKTQSRGARVSVLPRSQAPEQRLVTTGLSATCALCWHLTSHVANRFKICLSFGRRHP